MSPPTPPQQLPRKATILGRRSSNIFLFEITLKTHTHTHTLSLSLTHTHTHTFVKLTSNTNLAMFVYFQSM